MGDLATRLDIKTATCSSCGAEIIWAHIVKKDGTPGKMPFDKDPVQDGTHYLTLRPADGSVHAVYLGRKAKEWPLGAMPRVSHFSTCPHAEKHRRER